MNKICDNTYFLRIKVEDKELNEIMKKLEEAKRQIYECYNMLDELGAIRISKEIGERNSMSYPKVIAVDFDGCLCESKWPDIGDANWNAINALIRRKAEGDKIILWTCRDGKMLQDAVDWCYNRGLKFDAVNDNLEENKVHFGNNTRKVFAHEYWDDKAIPVVAYSNPLAG